MRSVTVRRTVGCLLAGVLAVGALAACTSDPVAASARTPAPSATRPAPSPRPSTPPPTQDVATATPLHVRCARLVPTAVARRLAQELRLVKGFEPKPLSSVARLSALAGTACAWHDEAGDALQVAVAKPSARDATALKNDLVGRSNSVPTYRGEAYFRVVDHVGEVNAFRGRTWILARSNRFFEPGDAIEVVAAADRALGFAPRAAPAPTPTPSAPSPATPAPAATPAAPSSPAAG